MMHLERVLLGGTLLLLLGNAHALDGKKIFTEGGSQPGAMPCVACHGPDGLGLSAAGFPRLAGLPAEYVRKQLADFSSGARNNPVMQPLAKALTEAQMAAVSEAVSTMPFPARAPQHRAIVANPVRLTLVCGLALLIEAAKQAFKTRLPSSQTRCWHPRKHILVVHRTTSLDVHGIVFSHTGTMPALGSCTQLVQGAGRCFCSRAHSKPARRAQSRQHSSCAVAPRSLRASQKSPR